MIKTIKNYYSHPDSKERQKRFRDSVYIFVIFLSLAFVAILEKNLLLLDNDFYGFNGIILLTLINVNLFLLSFLIYFAFKNLIKLFYDKEHKILGSKLGRKVVILLTVGILIPSMIIFSYGLKLITSSMDFWFNVPMEAAYESTLTAKKRLNDYIGERNTFLLEKASYKIDVENMLDGKHQKELEAYSQETIRDFNINGFEIYTKDFKRISSNFLSDMNLDEIEKLKAQDVRYFGEKTYNNIIKKGKDQDYLRTIGTIPYGIKPVYSRGFIVITVLLPSDLSKDFRNITQVFKKYKKEQRSKRYLKTSYTISLIIVALFTIVGAISFAFRFASSVTEPIFKLAEGTKKLAEGNRNFKIKVSSEDEIGSLVHSFNKMTKDLSHGEKKLLASEKLLQKQNKELEAAKQYLAIILENVSAGVISVNDDGRIDLVNKAASKMLQIESKNFLNQRYEKLFGKENIEIANQIKEKMKGDQKVFEMPIDFNVNNNIKNFILYGNKLEDEDKGTIFLFVFDDLTELERAQRIAAWRDVARRVAHEIKNPLTPIVLSAERLERKYGKNIKEEAFSKCTKTIVEHSNLIRNLINEFATFAKFPKATLSLSDLGKIVKEVFDSYQGSYQNIGFKLQIEENLSDIKIDYEQIKRVIINLIDNAISAIKGQGTITINLFSQDEKKKIVLEVIDSGSGISDEKKKYLFNPYFSTKKTGMGLGLAIVNTILSDHNATILVEDNVPQGSKFIVKFNV